MVQLHMKRSDQEQFLFETTVESTVKDTIAEMVAVHNLRQKINRLNIECQELAKYGPAKHPEKQGIDEYQEDKVEKGANYTQDPTGRRTGNACSPDVAKVLLKTCEDAVAAAHKNLVEKKVFLSRKALQDAVDNVRGAVMICYPMGLPDWDWVRVCLEDKDDAASCASQFGSDDLEAEGAQLWFAGKQMANEKKLSDYLGRHEKTKAVVKLQKKGSGAPSREPAVDQDTQKAMMAWYYKKQEEQKKLAEDEDDAYTGAAWASGKSLKAHFAGVGSSVRIPK